MKILKIILGIILFLAVAVIVIGAANSSKYRMAVNIIEKEDFIGINPTDKALDFGDLPKNLGALKYLELENKGKMPVYLLAIKTGEISGLVKSDKTFFSMNPGEESKIALTLNAPFSAKNKKYEGSLYILHFPKIF